MSKLMEALNLSSIYSIRDISVHDDIGPNTSVNLAK